MTDAESDAAGSDVQQRLATRATNWHRARRIRAQLQLGLVPCGPGWAPRVDSRIACAADLQQPHYEELQQLKRAGVTPRPAGEGWATLPRPLGLGSCFCTPTCFSPEQVLLAQKAAQVTLLADCKVVLKRKLELAEAERLRAERAEKRSRTLEGCAGRWHLVERQPVPTAANAPAPQWIQREAQIIATDRLVGRELLLQAAEEQRDLSWTLLRADLTRRPGELRSRAAETVVRQLAVALAPPHTANTSRWAVTQTVLAACKLVGLRCEVEGQWSRGITNAGSQLASRRAGWRPGADEGDWATFDLPPYRHRPTDTELGGGAAGAAADTDRAAAATARADAC
jgi:hypothetical protein